MSFSSATSTIPVCSNSFVRGGCVFSTSICIPMSVKPVLTLDELLDSDPIAQILHVMCTHGFLWNPCCGPIGATNTGFTFVGLLAELQEVFPESNWTADDLTTFLKNGISQGALKFCGLQQTYFANQNLLNVNPKNWAFEDICPQFCAKKGCVQKCTSSATAAC